ncbi:MAG: PTS sugar transporter subunit IIA [Planctomycetes bacterium]|nr:PTS sugar transporter subunit IIA [Planctomycetota bacterium]
MQLTVRDAAKLLDVSEKTLYRWVDDKKLPVYKVNDQVRISKAELLEWATANKIRISGDMFQEPDSAGRPLPPLSKALEAGGAYYHVPGTEKASVLKSMVERLRLPPEIEREFLFSVLMARESIGSTGIGDGIAIPHVRNPVVLHVAEPCVTVCFLEKAIDFESVDGKPVHTLFSLISPTPRAHLHLLSRLCAALNDPGFKAAVLQKASFDALLAEARRVEAEAAPGAKA